MVLGPPAGGKAFSPTRSLGDRAPARGGRARTTSSRDAGCLIRQHSGLADRGAAVRLPFLSASMSRACACNAATAMLVYPYRSTMSRPGSIAALGSTSSMTNRPLERDAAAVHRRRGGSLPQPEGYRLGAGTSCLCRPRQSGVPSRVPGDQAAGGEVVLQGARAGVMEKRALSSSRWSRRTTRERSSSIENGPRLARWCGVSSG
jgi:hypothetical protein